jgi:hypothetical protein
LPGRGWPPLSALVVRPFFAVRERINKWARARHPEAIQTELLAGLGAAVDAAGGTFTMSYTTIAATAWLQLAGI